MPFISPSLQTFEISYQNVTDGKSYLKFSLNTDWCRENRKVCALNQLIIVKDFIKSVFFPSRIKVKFNYLLFIKGLGGRVLASPNPLA